MKVWNCEVDDPRFKNINPAQWRWYAEMVAKEKREEGDKIIESIEYLASFWNNEAVRKIRSSRKEAESHRFKSDEEFEKSIVEGTYLDDPVVQDIINRRKNQDTNYNDSIEHTSDFKIPKNLKSLLDSIAED